MGDYRSIQNKVDLKLNNVIVIISSDDISFSGIPGLALSEEKYKITRRTEESLFFQHPLDSKYQGALNRYTGNIHLIHMDVANFKWFQSFDGTCRVAQKLF